MNPSEQKHPITLANLRRRAEDLPPVDVQTFLKRELKTIARLHRNIEALESVKGDIHGLEWACFRLSLLELHASILRLLTISEKEGDNHVAPRT